MAKFHHLQYEERLKLEALYTAGISKKLMAAILGCALSTVYAELHRGYYRKLDTELRWVDSYSADIAQQDYNYKASAKGAPLKIGNDHNLANYIQDKIKDEHWSPDVVLGYIRRKKLKFATTICTRTLYNYIYKGVLAVSADDLLEKGKRRNPSNSAPRPRYKRPLARSIDERPKEAENREFGHWEMDTVIGTAKGKNAALLVLTDRQSRYEIIEKLQSRTQDEVIKALSRISQQYEIKMNTLTVDNGSEFLSSYSIEFNENIRRTTLYYCHPYSSWERGSNENQNRIIRRYIPKGASINAVTEEELQQIQDWMNNYPRKILGYRTPAEVLQTKRNEQIVNNSE